MRWIALTCSLLAAAFPSTSASAQLTDLPVSVELRAGVLAPAGDWDVDDRDATLSAGAGPLFAAAVRLGLPHGFSTYGAFDYSLPGCRDCSLVGLSDRLSELGYGFGIGYLLPDLLPLALRIDVGGITQRLSFRRDGESRPSEFGLGLRAALTGSFSVGTHWFIEPSLAFHGYSARFELEEREVFALEVRSLSPQVGIRYRIR